MKKYWLIAGLISLLSGQSHACLEAFQYKIFPVAHDKKSIYTVDFKIRRFSEVEVVKYFKWDIKEPKSTNVAYALYAFVNQYDYNQKLISSMAIDTQVVVGSNYADVLQISYEKGYDAILQFFPKIKLLIPTTASDCNYLKTCEKVSIHNDVKVSKGHLTYNNTNFPLTVLNDSSYFSFIGNPEYNMSDMGIGTIRSFKLGKKKTLIVTHLMSALDIQMEYILPMSQYEAEPENEFYIFVEEYFNPFPFQDIKSAVFQEKQLEHGYGVDVFIVK